MSAAVRGRFRLYVLYAISFVSFFQADAIHASLNVLDVRFSIMLFSFLFVGDVIHPKVALVIHGNNRSFRLTQGVNFYRLLYLTSQYFGIIQALT